MHVRFEVDISRRHHQNKENVIAASDRLHQDDGAVEIDESEKADDYTRWQ